MSASPHDAQPSSASPRTSASPASMSQTGATPRIDSHERTTAGVDVNPSRRIDSAFSEAPPLVAPAGANGTSTRTHSTGTSDRPTINAAPADGNDGDNNEGIELEPVVSASDASALGRTRGRRSASDARTCSETDMNDAPKRSSTPGYGRAMTTVSSSATLCHLSDDEGEYFGRHKTKDSVDHTPMPFSTIPEGEGTAASPPASSSPPVQPPQQSGSRATAVPTSNAAPPIPAPDVVAYFDPASAGGGGPLARITTQQRERAEAEARERAERAHREAMGLPITPVGEGFTGGGILNRFRSGSVGSMTSKRRARFVTPLLHHEEETHSRTSVSFRPTLTPSVSASTLAGTPGPDSGKDVVWSEGGSESQVQREEYVYPDGGYGWVVVVCCMTLAGVCLGQGMNYGAYQSYYSRVAFPEASSAYISVVGTINAFCLNAAAFFFGRMGDRFGYKRILYISAFVAWLGMFIASFCDTLWLLLLFQGILGGIGQGMAMPLFMSLPSQWFYRRRGLASGLALSGAGLGGGISILIVRELLEKFGYKRTLLIMSFINAFFAFLAVFFIRTRPASPEASGGGRGPWVDKAVMKESGFWSISISLVVATLGYGAPWIYLQQWVELELPHVEPTLTAIPATIISFCLVIGRGVVGLVADHVGPLNTYALVFILSGAVQFALWLTAHSFAHICVFSAVYGIVAPGFLGLIPQIVVQLFGPTNLASNVGVLILFNGPGNMGCAPLSGSIYDSSGRTTFKWVIIVNGLLQVAGGLIALWAKFKASRHLLAKV